MANMTSMYRWRRIQRACEWPIAALALGSAAVLLAYRMGELPNFTPLGVWVAVSVGLIAGLGVLALVGAGIFALWRAHAGQGHVSRGSISQRAIGVLKAGLKLKSTRCVCRACVGRGFTWTLAPGDDRRRSGAQALQARQDTPTRLKVECPSCGGSGFTDA